MSNNTIADEMMEFLDLYKAPSMKEIFEILHHLGNPALHVEYSHEDDIFLAQYDDKSYIIARNVLGDAPGPDFESGVLSDEGWRSMQSYIADNRQSLCLKMN